MKCKIFEKFEVAIFDPATREYRGGSMHAAVIVDGKVTRQQIADVQAVMDNFDHSTVVSDAFATKEELAAVSERGAVVSNAADYCDMMMALAKHFVIQVSALGLTATKIKIWSDKGDVEFIFSGSEIKTAKPALARL